MTRDFRAAEVVWGLKDQGKSVGDIATATGLRRALVTLILHSPRPAPRPVQSPTAQPAAPPEEEQ